MWATIRHVGDARRILSCCWDGPSHLQLGRQTKLSALHDKLGKIKIFNEVICAPLSPSNGTAVKIRIHLYGSAGSESRPEPQYDSCSLRILSMNQVVDQSGRENHKRDVIIEYQICCSRCSDYDTMVQSSAVLLRSYIVNHVCVVSTFNLTRSPLSRFIAIF